MVGQGYNLEAAALCSRKRKLGTFDSSSNREVWKLPVDPEGSRGSEASIISTHMTPSHDSESYCSPAGPLT